MVDGNELSSGTVDLDLDDIKARLEGGFLLIKIIRGGAHDVELLAFIHGVLTPQKRIGGAGFHLNKGDGLALLRDNINFAELVIIILFKNFIALLFQITGGEFFTQRAEFSVGKCFGHRCGRRLRTINDRPYGWVDMLRGKRDRTDRLSGRRGAVPYIMLICFACRRDLAEGLREEQAPPLQVYCPRRDKERRALAGR